jgi:hypothetical protein
MNARNISALLLLFVSSLFLIIAFFVLNKWRNSNEMLKEARETSSIAMRKIRTPEGCLSTFKATVDMTPAKWRYHRGLPLVILDPKNKSPEDFFKNIKISFILTTDQKKMESVVFSAKNVRVCYDWLRTKTHSSQYSFCLSPVGLNSSVRLINYARGINEVKLIFEPPLAPADSMDVQATLYFIDGEETAVPTLYLLLSLIIGTVGVVSAFAGFYLRYSARCRYHLGW